jgi:hypothetical protein
MKEAKGHHSHKTYQITKNSRDMRQVTLKSRRYQKKNVREGASKEIFNA